MLFNLIKNALYYLGPYPRTRLTIRVGDQQVRVRDNGPGIAPEALPGLFEPFRSAGKSGGTGLGLAYCQRVMRAFGGEIRCESVPGEFTEFAMHFPTIAEEERQAHWRTAIAQARAALTGKRVLVVEDDPLQRLATRHKLGPLAVTVELDEAADGQIALEKLAARPWDVVLLDLHMPGLDGYAVADRIRRQPGPNQDVRIVAYTSEPAHLARAKALKGGMDGFIGKPCAQLPLLAALQQAVQQPRGLRRNAGGRLAGRRILLADDSSFNRKAVAACLRGAEATVVEAGHGQAVLDELASGARFDAVVMDLQMPGLDGLAAARAIRASGEPWAGVPLVALTAHSDAPAQAGARSAGMNGFLTKPVEAAVLYETLLRVLGEGGPVAAPPPAVPQEGLLNLERLGSYQRLGLLGELLEDYLPEMTRHLASLAAAVPAGDRQSCLDALHALLGMSGEAGAQALYHQVRRVYVPLLEDGQWPAAAGWLEQLQALAKRTEQALKAFCAAEAADRGT